MERKPRRVLLSYDDLKERGYINNRMTLMRRIARGEFPAPIKLSARNLAWLQTELDSWLAALVADRRSPKKRPKRR
jgi:hypothetical protein